MAKKSTKIFILDTNVILHDSSCILQFKENDIIIPLTVIEELDHFKRGSQVINLNAREFARTLDSMTGSALFNGGVSLGKGRGKVRIAITKGLLNEIREMFIDDTPDHRILSTALEIHNKNKNRSVILVSKDVNLRMKAKAIGIPAEDYTTDMIGSVEELYSGKEIIDDFDDEILMKLYQSPFEVPIEIIKKELNGELLPNKFYILRNNNRSVLAHYDPIKEVMRKVDNDTDFDEEEVYSERIIDEPGIDFNKPDKSTAAASNKIKLAKTQEQSQTRSMEKIREAKLKGYTGDICQQCHSVTMVRNGTCLKCITCGETSGCS